MITAIPSAEVDIDRLRPFLNSFVVRSTGRWTFEDLADRVQDGRLQVWRVNDWQAVCLTSIRSEGVYVEACAGSGRHEWMDELDDEITRWARFLGHKRVFSFARPGWVPWARTRGYRELHREVVKELA